MFKEHIYTQFWNTIEFTPMKRRHRFETHEQRRHPVYVALEFGVHVSFSPDESTNTSYFSGAERLSSACISSALRVRPEAPRLSASWAGVLAPMMTEEILGLVSSQARAIWAGVWLWLWPNSSSLSSRSKLRSVSRRRTLLRRWLSGGVWPRRYLPVRKPRPR